MSLENENTLLEKTFQRQMQVVSIILILFVLIFFLINIIIHHKPSKHNFHMFSLHKLSHKNISSKLHLETDFTRY